jgi:UDP-N-acetylglucosamine--N-acetylmuramyl-(pentapeptide) pyrophosphoryl-undecaprenol N-acetylglucosamine transferase
MMITAQREILVAIACGGTGGHFYPGLAVALELRRRGCSIMLLVSPKEVDQQAVKSAAGMEVVTLPAVGLARGRELEFLRGFVHSYREAGRVFGGRPPQAALAMGGFTGAPPLLAAKRRGARAFLHEANSVPGRANRWLSWFVDEAFVAFPSAGARLHARNVTASGMPVRPRFEPRDPALCREALGLDPARPVLLVMGGSQGAGGINRLVLRALPLLARAVPALQVFHLTGSAEWRTVEEAYKTAPIRGVAKPFFDAMELALGAATVCVSRAGASSLAELAAMGVPPVLIPYPAATDNHQFLNARALEADGAARLMEQQNATPEGLAAAVAALAEEGALRSQTRRALARWHAPDAARRVADSILRRMAAPAPGAAGAGVAPARRHRSLTA